MRWRPAWLAPIDSWWWQMDHPTNLAYVHFLFAFDRLPDYPAFLELLETRLLVHRRFRCRVARAWRILGNEKFQVGADAGMRPSAYAYALGLSAQRFEIRVRRIETGIQHTALECREFPRIDRRHVSAHIRNRFVRTESSSTARRASSRSALPAAMCRRFRPIS